MLTKNLRGFASSWETVAAWERIASCCEDLGWLSFANTVAGRSRCLPVGRRDEHYARRPRAVASRTHVTGRRNRVDGRRCAAGCSSFVAMMSSGNFRKRDDRPSGAWTCAWRISKCCGNQQFAIQTVEMYLMASSVRKSVWTFVRELLGPHLSTCAWWSNRSSSEVTAPVSPSSLPQSSTGRFDVMGRLGQPTPNASNDEEIWPCAAGMGVNLDFVLEAVLGTYAASARPLE